MEDNFDKKLSNKIREVVEDQSFSYNPEHWNMLLAKKEEKKKKRFVFLWRSAAVLLLVIAAGSIGRYYFQNPNKLEKLENKIIIGKRKDSINKNIFDRNQDVRVVEEEIDTAYNPLTTKPNNAVIHKVKVPDSQFALQNKSIPKEIDNKNSLEDPFDKTLNPADKKEAYDQNKEGALVKDRDDITVAEKNIKKDSLRDIKEIIASKTEESTIFPEKRSRSMKIGLNISSGTNYIQQINNSNLGFAGGISMDFSVSNKLDLYSGLIYTNQELNMNDKGLVFDAGPGFIDGENTKLRSEKAVLKGIEIPVNLKYNFSIDKKKMFVSGGFSSTYYFEEDVVKDYIISSRTETIIQDPSGNNLIVYELVQNNKKVVRSDPGSDFNFANILNLSMGIEFPLNRQQQSIVLEPYFKYSIHPVTYQNIDFSSMGIFLRYNFEFYKK